MLSVTKREMIRWLQGFLRKKGYQVRQSALWQAFPGGSYGELSRRLYGIFRRAVRVHIRTTIHDLNRCGVMTLPPLGPPASTQRGEPASTLASSPTSRSGQRGEPSRQPSPHQASMNSSTKILRSAKVEFLKRNYRFRACVCGYLDPDRQASVCPNCGEPKVVREPVNKVV